MNRSRVILWATVVNSGPLYRMGYLTNDVPLIGPRNRTLPRLQTTLGDETSQVRNCVLAERKAHPSPVVAGPTVPERLFRGPVELP